MLRIYLAICALAFMLKLVFSLAENRKGKSLAHQHHKEHDTGNYIKILILFLLGLLLLYLKNANPSINYSDA